MLLYECQRYFDEQWLVKLYITVEFFVLLFINDLDCSILSKIVLEILKGYQFNYIIGILYLHV